MRKRVLIFDYDGVIVDSLDEVWDMFKDIKDNYGLRKIDSKKKFLDMFKGNFYKLAVRYGMPKKKEYLMMKDIRKNLIKRQYKIFLFKNIKKILNRLSENNEIIIISSNITLVVAKYLKSHNIKIKNIIGADKEPSKVKKIKLIKKKYPKSEIYYIGDTTGDIKEGRKAKVKIVAVTWGYHSKKQLKATKPDYIAGKPEDLVKLFLH